MKSISFRFFAVTFIISLSLSGCNKNEDDPDKEIPCFPYSNPVYRIREIISVSNNDSAKTIYYYDSLNRLQHEYDSGNYVSDTYYEYISDKVILSSSDSITGDYFYSLDSNGYAVRDKMGFYFWEYDSSGYMVKETNTYPNAPTRIYHYSYSCYNIDSVTTEVINSTGVHEPLTYTIKEYYDQLNTIGNENLGKGFLGKQNNCLLKSSTIKNPAEGISTITYTYETDSLNRVTKEIATRSDTVISTRDFKYY